MAAEYVQEAENDADVKRQSWNAAAAAVTNGHFDVLDASALEISVHQHQQHSVHPSLQLQQQIQVIVESHIDDDSALNGTC